MRKLVIAAIDRRLPLMQPAISGVIDLAPPLQTRGMRSAPQYLSIAGNGSTTEEFGHTARPVAEKAEGLAG